MRRAPLIVGVIVALILGVAFYELAEDFAYSPAVAAADAAAAAWAESVRTPVLTVVMEAITISGDVLSVTLATLVLGYVLLRRGCRRDAIFAVGLVGTGAATAFLLKGAFDRPRPPAEEALIALPASSSFPSGHAMCSLCLAATIIVVAIAWPASRRVLVFASLGAVLWAFLVGLSRVYLGVHFASDVVASWLLGGAIVSLAIGWRASLPACGQPTG